MDQVLANAMANQGGGTPVTPATDSKSISRRWSETYRQISTKEFWKEVQGLAGLLANLRSHKDDVDHVNVKLGDAIGEIDESYNETIEQIDLNFQKLVEKLAERKQALMYEAKELRDAQMKGLRQQQDKVGAVLFILQDHFEHAELAMQVLKEDDLKDVYAQTMKHIQDIENDESLKHPPVDPPQISCSFDNFIDNHISQFGMVYVLDVGQEEPRSNGLPASVSELMPANQMRKYAGNYPMLGDRSKMSGQMQPLDISVMDPEQHGDPPRQFMDFKVVTKTSLPQYKSSTVFVRRRFRDFLWLRQQLCHKHLNVLVPPLPDQHAVGAKMANTAKFIEERRAGLEMFMRQVAMHPKLCESPMLQVFLEAKCWELETAKGDVVKGGMDERPVRASRMSEETDLFVRRISDKHLLPAHDETDDEAAINSLKGFVQKYEDGCQALVTASGQIAKSNKGLGEDLAALGPSLNLLAQSEVELCEPLTTMASCLNTVGACYNAQAEGEGAGLQALLQFNLGMVDSVKEVLVNREKAIVKCRKAANNHSSTTNAHVQWQANHEQHQAGPPEEHEAVGIGGHWKKMQHKILEKTHDVDKGDKLLDKLDLHQLEMVDTKAQLTSISDGLLKHEMPVFHQVTSQDLKDTLRGHISSQIAITSQVQAYWENLLPMFEAIDVSTAPTHNFEQAALEALRAAPNLAGPGPHTLANSKPQVVTLEVTTTPNGKAKVSISTIFWC